MSRLFFPGTALIPSLPDRFCWWIWVSLLDASALPGEVGGLAQSEGSLAVCVQAGDRSDS